MPLSVGWRGWNNTLDGFFSGRPSHSRLNPNVLDSGFFFYFLQSPLWQRQLAAIMAQTTRNQVSIQKQANFSVVVAPLAEQHRIVAKVEELLAVCDHLEAQLEAGRVAQAALLEATLRDALQA
jgi:type I restriction enzyme S subunit